MQVSIICVDFLYFNLCAGETRFLFIVFILFEVWKQTLVDYKHCLAQSEDQTQHSRQISWQWSQKILKECKKTTLDKY